ncbi:hypothetical protein LCGC14_2352940 [marine sediment metagenome]|uniref:Uncharacterized protein n=1 Tax=marine sediment metagenome TaxID=412755 RepID=A0A0F9ELC4_9ZZZZ
MSKLDKILHNILVIVIVVGVVVIAVCGILSFYGVGN